MATSIVDYLKSSGQDSSLSSRAKLAVDNGLVGSSQEYLTLASQGKNGDINSQLLSKLQSPAPNPTPSPTAPPQTDASAAASMNSNTITSSQIEKGAGLPEPTTYAGSQTVTPFSDRVSEVAKSTLTSSQLEIDKLRQELQSITEKEKATATATKNKLTGQIEDFVGTTAAQDALTANNKKFKVEENIQLYSDIQTKLVDAQQALEVGLIYEKDRPARMKFITGAESTLMKQGLATIGALQGTAAVIKGNLDLARAFGDSTVAAITQDNEQSFKALTTLLDLATNDLINLDAKETDQINARLSAIETQNTTIQQNKDDVMTLMQTNPKAFLAGGVTLLDSKEEALRKMLPTMAADERALFEASIAKSTSTSTDKDGPAADKQQLLQLKANGMTLAEAIDAFGDTVSVAWIKSVYGDPVDPKTAAESAAYGQYLNPDGTFNSDKYTATVKDGKTTVEEKSKGGSVWYKPWTWGS